MTLDPGSPQLLQSWPQKDDSSRNKSLYTNLLPSYILTARQNLSHHIPALQHVKLHVTSVLSPLITESKTTDYENSIQMNWLYSGKSQIFHFTDHTFSKNQKVYSAIELPFNIDTIGHMSTNAAIIAIKFSIIQNEN